uniref:Uncharacterized protein n=1 Tax=Ixodes ricinus TaxID=34613 RepID=A0A6B0TTG1_IXORI
MIQPYSGVQFIILSVLIKGKEVLAQCWCKFLAYWQNVAGCSIVSTLVQMAYQSHHCWFCTAAARLPHPSELEQN